MKILIVDDSITFRNILTKVIEMHDPSFKVYHASNGIEAVDTFKKIGADLIILDIEMPLMNGVEAVSKLRELHKSVPIIMLTTITERYAKKVMEALSNGATEYLTKGTLDTIEQNIDHIKRNLIPILISKQHKTLVPLNTKNQDIKLLVNSTEVLAIGSSTGGPDILRTILSEVSGSNNTSIFIIQHMPEFFTEQFALNLNRISSWEVKEASDSEVVQKGTIYVAPGNRHMTVKVVGDKKIICITDEAKHNFLRPSIDITLKSLANAYKSNLFTLILTGMGNDGTQGSRDVLEQGGKIAIQDKNSSLIWGMPESVLNAKITETVLNIEQIKLLINSL